MTAVPEIVGPYRRLERIGLGGMAAVYRARRHGASGFSKQVALKLLLPEHEHDAELQRLLIAEAKLGAAMAHRNLVSVFDLGVDDGRYYAVMELVEGGDLRTLGSPSEALALFIVEEIGSALAYVHGFTDERGRPLGLVHRDISPSNVLVSRGGGVKLADYGIAKATKLAEQTRARIVRGKYAYLSPEQLDGAALSPATDQFALGVTLVELVSGHRPFDGDNPVQIMDRICEGDPDLVGVPPDLLPLVQRCLQGDPAARYPDLHALLVDLRDARRRRPPVGPPELASWVGEQLG